MKKNKLNFLIFTIILCIVLSFLLLNTISKKIMPSLIEYTISKINNNITKIVNKSLLNISDDNIYIINKDDTGAIRMIEYNNKELNNKLNNINSIILEQIENINPSIYEVPLGIATNNIFLSNIGPKIPIKLNAVGDITSNIDTEIINYGINNALIKVYIKITISEEVIAPFINKKNTLDLKVPISIKIIEGNVPKYYGGSINKESSILSLPIEE